jgi:collagen type VII alpha
VKKATLIQSVLVVLAMGAYGVAAFGNRPNPPGTVGLVGQNPNGSQYILTGDAGSLYAVCDGGVPCLVPQGTGGGGGATGPTGPTGPTGADGLDGIPGATGPTGPTGAAGSNGSNGAVGATGPTGPTGAAGSNGSNGAVGATGPTGPTGATGPNWGTIASTDILYGQGTATPTWSSDYTWTDATQTLGVGATAGTAAITFGSPVTGASISQTAPTSDVAPNALTITAQGPFASASTNKSSAALNLKTVAPVSGGTAGAITAAPGGTTALQLGAASTDYLAMGASPASAGFLRFPALASTTTILQLGTIPVLWNNSGSLVAGATTLPLQLISSAGVLLSPSGAAAGWTFNSTGLSINTTSALTIGPSSKATAISVTLTSGAGVGAASTSSAGAALSLAGGAAAVATAGTAAGTAGGPASLTGGAGAAGLGSNQNGGAGGNTTIGSGAGGAATGAGTVGAAGSVIVQVGSTTVTSYGVSGVGDVPSNVVVSGVTGGTTNLTAAQYLNRIIRLSGTLTSASTVAFPNVAGRWEVDVSGLAGLSGTNTLTFQSGSATTTAITTLVTNSSILTITTYGSNTISINL